MIQLENQNRLERQNKLGKLTLFLVLSLVLVFQAYLLPVPGRKKGIEKLKEWMHNEITIAGIPLVIPYEGEYGPSWGDMSVGTIYMDDPQVYRPPLAD